MRRKFPHFRAFDRLRRPYVAVMIIVVIVCTALIYATDGDYSLPQTMYSFAHICLLVGLYWHPTYCACAIIALSIAAELAPEAMFMKQLWCLWLAAGLLGYHRRLRMAFSLLLIQTLIMMMSLSDQHQMDDWNVPGVLSFNIICAIMLVVGYALAEHQEADRLRRKAQERERLAIEQERLRRDMALASRIHDSTTRGLALISLLSEECITDSANAKLPDVLKERITLIGSTARSTLQDVRKVIDVLNRDERDERDADAKGESTSDEPMESMLTQLLADNDKHMAAIGVQGSSVMTSSASSALTVSCIDRETMQEVRDLINQMYTNIAVHGARGTDAYHVRMELTDRALRIREFNAIGRTDDRLHTGKGLSMHRTRIMAMGGILHTHGEDDIWTLQVEIPIQPHTSSHSSSFRR
ncbi:sensor histidine kinase [Bifidobacterium callitrichos]|uniref:Histidine kinase n=1 Tax=Bifidobacterium callitrichos DSM 23973 TaxID=1437609 RepID=A0A086ZZB6_9BIFI|nr:histidine kinase [Bifidobacterium callitrichos]KFI51866.1 histidine kinase [Bifidobacterium callitrichos DSM 23973]